MNKYLVTCLAAWALGLGGCRSAGLPPPQSSWPFFQADQIHSGSLASNKPAQAPFELRWQFAPQNRKYNRFSSPVVRNGRLFSGSRSGQLYALKAFNGQVLWQTQLDSWVDSAPALSQGRVYCATTSGTVYALSQSTGQILWQHQLGEPHKWSSPITDSTQLYLGTTAGSVWALSNQNGAPVWQQQLTAPVEASPLLAAGDLIIATMGGQVHSLDRRTGQILWSTRPNDGAPIFSTPTIDQNGIYLADYSGTLIALDPHSGTELWRFKLSDAKFWSSPALRDGILYLGCNNGYFYAFDTQERQLLWRFTTLGRGMIDTSPAVGEQLVIFAALDGNLYALNRASGQPSWSKQLGAQAFSSPALVDGWIFLGSGPQGRLHAFSGLLGH